VQIRAERDEDWAAVRAVNESAFETPAEADLVDVLRERVRPLVSIVAEEGGAIIGHILFSPVVLPAHPELEIMGLAPMAVVPEHQRNGVGSELVHAGLEACRNLGCGAVVVLGHPRYYPRFGFISASRLGIGCHYEAPEEAFMAIELQSGYLRGASGKVRYHAAFDDL
jgi:putative acetyltransferase